MAGPSSFPSRAAAAGGPASDWPATGLRPFPPSSVSLCLFLLLVYLASANLQGSLPLSPSEPEPKLNHLRNGFLDPTVGLSVKLSIWKLLAPQLRSWLLQHIIHIG